MRTLLGLCFCLFTITAQAESLPKDFYYLGKPIDALCFYENENKPVSLKTCGIHADSDRKISGSNDYMTNKGYVGYDYTWPLSSSPSNCASYYKVIDKINDRYVILTYNNSGGTGNFSDVTLVKRQDDNLYFESIVGGDRCNGGITTAYREHGNVFIEQNLTAYDLVKAAKNAKSVEAYEGLAACAICCSATVTYKLNADAKRLIPVRYDLVKTSEPLTQGKYQVCFNRLVSKQKKQGMQTLTPAELESFVQLFNETCLR